MFCFEEVGSFNSRATEAIITCTLRSDAPKNIIIQSKPGKPSPRDF